MKEKQILQEGEYTIPKGYTAKKVGSTLKVYKSKRNVLHDDDYRCKDCVHFVKGFSTNSGLYETNVCDMFPTRITDGGIYRYKAVQKYAMPCFNFQAREKKQ